MAEEKTCLYKPWNKDFIEENVILILYIPNANYAFPFNTFPFFGESIKVSEQKMCIPHTTKNIIKFGIFYFYFPHIWHFFRARCKVWLYFHYSIPNLDCGKFRVDSTFLVYLNIKFSKEFHVFRPIFWDTFRNCWWKLTT